MPPEEQEEQEEIIEPELVPLLHIICDANDVVQDIATEAANLSRGKTFPGHKQYSVFDVVDIRIGDTFKDGVLTKNQTLRQERIQQQGQEQKIQAMQRKLAVRQLKIDGDLPEDF